MSPTNLRLADEKIICVPTFGKYSVIKEPGILKGSVAKDELSKLLRAGFRRNYSYKFCNQRISRSNETIAIILFVVSVMIKKHCSLMGPRMGRVVGVFHQSCHSPLPFLLFALLKRPIPLVRAA